MQAVILCGGQGTRIRDVADDVPKPMIPIGDKPILWHIMNFYRSFGIRRFVLCLGYKSWVIKRFFLDYHLAASDITVCLDSPSQVEIRGKAACDDWEVTLAETGLDAMTGARVKRIERYIDGENFMLTYGDGLADVDLFALTDFHRNHGRLATVTAVRPPGRFGELELADGKVAEFNEKPNLSRGFINGGYFVLNRKIFKRLRDDSELVFEQEPLTELSRDGELMAFPHEGFWHPMDTGRDHRYLNDLWNRSEAPWVVGQNERTARRVA